MIRDLYGPRNGSEEIISVTDPYAEYIIGTLKPIESASNSGDNIVNSDNDTINLMDQPVPDDIDSEISDIVSNISQFERPSSFGLSFQVDNNNANPLIVITWGTYHKIENGNTWKRKPHKFSYDCKLQNSESRRMNISYPNSNIKLIFNIKRENNIFILSLINKTELPDKKERTENVIFQPSIRINIKDGKLLDTLNVDDEISYLYRDKKVYGKGLLCSAIWKDIDYNEQLDNDLIWPDGKYFHIEPDFFTCDLRSEFIPLITVPSALVSSHELSENFENIIFSASELSDMYTPSELIENFNPLIKRYKEWIDKNKKYIDNNMTQDIYGTNIINQEKRFLKKLENGIECLTKDENARLSFCFANRVMAFQQDESKGEFNWYPFQIAYILSAIPSLVSINSDDRDYMDLLWIPTGGGKTETYIFLSIFISSFRRLHYNDNSGYGTAVLSRYTLRLLTIQQFRRMVKAMTAAEYIRIRGWRPKGYKDRTGSKNSRDLFGKMRFSVGLWVGNTMTPHELRGDKGALENLSLKNGEKTSETAQILVCPFCGTRLSIQGDNIKSEIFDVYLTIECDDSHIITDSDLVRLIRDVEQLTTNTRIKTIIKSALLLNNIGYDGTCILKMKKTSGIGIDEISESYTHIRHWLTQMKAKFLPISILNPGYFPYGDEPGRQKKSAENYLNFEIYCPNPECKLNNLDGNTQYFEYEPAENTGSGKESTIVLKEIDNRTIFYKKRVPITAYTVDEQIYSRLPSVIIGTVDKLARLAYDPTIAPIFGNVNEYNPYYGFSRNGLYSGDTTIKARKSTINIPGFKPPDMIIQDELHLIDGPLGSMVGIYETTVDSLIIDNGGKLKYIASTATIKGGEIQARRVFNRELFQFPPSGKNIDDSFFIKYSDAHKMWEDKEKGKIYAGICSPGISKDTMYTRLMASMIHTNITIQNDSDSKYYWTIVNYFNSIKELGTGESLIEEDVKERLKQLQLSHNDPEANDLIYNHLELSGRVNSVDLPYIIDKLGDARGTNNKDKPIAVFATSMFGTGIDLPVLSSMIVVGQPKTTSQYIQATGRIGRLHGGIVITMLSAGRPRDLSHYEMFARYHLRSNMEIENISVSPFSTGAVSIAGGAVMTSFLRNMRNPAVDWYGKSPDVIHNSAAEEDLSRMNSHFEDRLKSIKEIDAMNSLKFELDRWKYFKENPDQFYFNRFNVRNNKSYSVLLGAPGDNYKNNVSVVYHNSPQSLRNIDETLAIRISRTAKYDNTQVIRRSQFIFSYGPGSIIETLKGPRVMLSLSKGLRSDGYRNLGNLDYLASREIKNEKIVSIITSLNPGTDKQIRLFDLPTNESENLDQKEYIYDSEEFPKWKICYNSEPHPEKENILFDHGIYDVCPSCHKSNNLATIRFISICKDGHMDDLPWNRMLHGHEERGHDYYTWNAHGPSLADITIKCPVCKVEKTMSQLYNVPVKCTGFIAEEDRHVMCKNNIKIVQRQSSSVRYPLTVTFLDLPETVDPLIKNFQDTVFASTVKIIIDLKNIEESTYLSIVKSSVITQDQKQLLIKFITINNIDNLKSAYEEFLKREKKVGFMDMIRKEYLTIKNKIIDRDENPDFIIDHNPFHIESGIDRIAFNIYGISKIGTVTSNIGYNRYKADKDSKIIYSHIDVPGNQYYAAFHGTGEALFIELEGIDPSGKYPPELDQYEDRNPLWNYSNKFSFFITHTLSHALIKSLSLLSGYSSSSLHERIYMDDTGQKSSILIYTSEPGEDGSLGGLTGLSKNELVNIVQNAKELIAHCSNDPLCIELKSYPINGAVCYSCLMLSETSCEHMNTGLDRSLFSFDKI